MSHSSTATRRPLWASSAARFTVQKLLPSPGTDEVTPITRLSSPAARYCIFTRIERKASEMALRGSCSMLSLSSAVPCGMMPSSGMLVRRTRSSLLCTRRLVRS